VLAVALAACSAGDDDEGLTVFAAASLRDVVAELEVAWLEEHPEVPLTFASEASNVLAAQIAEGAPADVFLSADTLRPQQLHEEGLTAAQPMTFAANRVTLVVPLEGDAVAVPEDLATAGVRLVGISPEAPISRYTLEAIAQLAGAMAEPQAWADAVQSNVVSEEDNVRAALAKVELGEGDAAFVYRTDALSTDGVREIALPEAAAAIAHYAAVQISERPGAAELLAWLTGPRAASIIEAAGFEAARG
jgi:molybdate transport system substrate-binding protein